jgi:hypothetical protein
VERLRKTLLERNGGDLYVFVEKGIEEETTDGENGDSVVKRNFHE